MCKISKFQKHSSVQNINVKQATIRMILDNGFQKKLSGDIRHYHHWITKGMQKGLFEKNAKRGSTGLRVLDSSAFIPSSCDITPILPYKRSSLFNSYNIIVCKNSNF